MKLSDAIVLGSTLLERGDYSSSDQKVGCVLQMAMVAIGKTRVWCAASTSPQYWPWLDKTELECPECGERNKANNIIPIHLNDWHKWSSERIADFVRIIEPSQPEVQADQLEAIRISDMELSTGER